MSDHSCGRGPLGCMDVVVRPISSLKPNPRNARTHSRRQIHQIADSIAAFGFNNPILVDESLNVLAGHGRIEAAKLNGMTEVPTVCLSHMSDAEKRAYVLADNKLAEKAGWDAEILAIEFQELFEIAPELDLTVTGFEIAEIDLILDNDDAEPDALDDFALPDADAPAVTRIGDLWLLGQHRVLCGDATQAAAYLHLLNGEEAQMTFGDPPYNLPVVGHVSGLGRVRHREFAMASGDMSEAAFTAFLTTVLDQVRSRSADGAIAFVCMGWQHLYELFAAGREAKLTLKNLIIWEKTNAGMGTFYAPSTNSSPPSKSEQGPTSTASSSASTADGERTCGLIPASTALVEAVIERSLCIRP